MKFIHMADVHLTMNPDQKYIWGQRRQGDIEETFFRVISYAIEEQIDLMFISGDLFHRQPTLQELKDLDYQLSKMPHTKTIFIAGNHDYLTQGCPTDIYEFRSDTVLLKGPELNYIRISELDTTVYGFSYWSEMETRPMYEGIKPNEEEGIHILLAHGGDSTHIPIDKEELKWSGFDYIALGHIHKSQTIYEDLMAYAGSLEPLDHTETGEHGFYVGEITEEKQIVSFVPFSKRRYVETEVLISEDMGGEEILDRIETEINYRGEDNIHQIILQGSMDPNVNPDYDRLKDQYMITDFIKEVGTNWDYDTVSKEDDLLLQAIADALREESKALSYAMEALKVSRER